MTAKACFSAKIATGRVDRAAGERLLDWIEEARAESADRMTAAEAARAAALEVAEDAKILAARETDLALRSIEAQVAVLDGVRAYAEETAALAEAGRAPVALRAQLNPFVTIGSTRAPAIGPAIRSLLARDPHEIATGPNVHYLARDLRGRAHALFAEAIEALRPKRLGLKAETALEHDVLRALHGDASVPETAQIAAEAWTRTAEFLRQEFNAAGGAIPERANWRLPQPHDADKVRAVPREGWKTIVRPLLDREGMVDFATGRRLSDDKLESVLDQVYDGIAGRGGPDAPSMAARGRPMLANERADARVLVFKDDEGWAAYHERFGPAMGVYEIMTRHIADMADDTAQLRILGPNPAGLRRYAESLFDAQAAALRGGADPADAKAVARGVKEIRAAENALRVEKRRTLHLWDEITGATAVPVNVEAARAMGEMRAALSGAQLGSAIISSISDQATLLMTARLNGVPAMGVIRRAVEGLADRTSEISAAQAGLVADAIAHTAREADRYMGETIRSGGVARISAAAIRASGLRRWTAVLRNAFALEFMAQGANHAGRSFGELPARFREALGRYGLDAAGWEHVRVATPWEERPGARLLRAEDIAAAGTPEAREAAERYARMVNTEMDHAVIENDPTTRALLFGGTNPGTAAGEIRRAVGLYKAFPITFVTLHMARAFARGWDGSRLAHGALTFGAMSLLGVVAMQAKQIAAGRDPYSLDPTTGQGARAWGAAVLQGGGFGIFGDMLFSDKTRYGNTWATTLAGPQFAVVEDVLGKWLLANAGRAWKGEETHFAGDALYTAARYVPGSSLWFGRLAFQRKVVDQLALMIDDRAPERFRRMEAAAEKDWSQRFWWSPGDTEPNRGPDFAAMTAR